MHVSKPGARVSLPPIIFAGLPKPATDARGRGTIREEPARRHDRADMPPGVRGCGAAENADRLQDSRQTELQILTDTGIEILSHRWGFA